MGIQHSPSTDNIVEQVVVADKGAKGVEGRAFLPAVLIGPDIQKVVVGKEGDVMFFHSAQFLPYT